MCIYIYICVCVYRYLYMYQFICCFIIVSKGNQTRFLGQNTYKWTLRFDLSSMTIVMPGISAHFNIRSAKRHSEFYIRVIETFPCFCFFADKLSSCQDLLIYLYVLYISVYSKTTWHRWYVNTSIPNKVTFLSLQVPLGGFRGLDGLRHGHTMAERTIFSLFPDIALRSYMWKIQPVFSPLFCT